MPLRYGVNDFCYEDIHGNCCDNTPNHSNYIDKKDKHKPGIGDISMNDMIVCKINEDKVNSNRMVYTAATLSDINMVPIVNTMDLIIVFVPNIYAMFDAD